LKSPTPSGSQYADAVSIETPAAVGVPQRVTPDAINEKMAEPDAQVVGVLIPSVQVDAAVKGTRPKQRARVRTGTASGNGRQFVSPDGLMQNPENATLEAPTMHAARAALASDQIGCRPALTTGQRVGATKLKGIVLV
jgi:hypothetical protein